MALGGSAGLRESRFRTRRLIAQNGAEAPKIAAIYRAYAGGDTSIAQTKRLAKEIGLRSRTGKPLATGTMAIILTNPIYRGRIQWNGQVYPGSHDPIVSEEVWERVQSIMHGRVNNKTGFGASSTSSTKAYFSAATAAAL